MKRQRTLFDCGLSLEESANNYQKVNYGSQHLSETEKCTDKSNNSTSTQTTETTTLESQFHLSCVNPSTKSPNQPSVNFPSTLIGGSQRSFNAERYKVFCWIEYSIQKDAVFCYPCRLFNTNHGRSHDIFTQVGFRNWKHASGKNWVLNGHNKCSSHIQAMTAWSQYKLNASQHTSIAERMDSHRAKLASDNRHYIGTLSEVILLCARQEIALRGHRESSNSDNRGNFREILTLMAAHDPIVSQRFFNGPQNAMYTSPEIQNTLLHIMGEMVREKLCAEVKEAGIYSILADETKDFSKTEQLSIVVRYVDVKTATIHERFLTFTEFPV